LTPLNRGDCQCNGADINAADAPAPAGQYTQAIEVTGASRTLYLSGQVGSAADGSIPADAEAQSALAWRNLQAQLRAAGMEIENLVKTTTIVCNPWRWPPPPRGPRSCDSDENSG
jgi:enamine deaminase RidA (YjgF/YER057c/UK114 family)